MAPPPVPVAAGVRSAEETPAASDEESAQIIGAREKLSAIYSAVDEMPLKVKQAFLLHRSSGMSYNDIAEEMQVSVSSVEKYILQALRHCRSRLAAHFPADDDPTEG